MPNNNIREGKWNPARVIKALGRIGYNPVSAILDIVDNSVSNGARSVQINILTESEEREGRGRRRTAVKCVIISDDGYGMTPERLEDAIALGASDELYGEATLSKFGMGLKSASASLGKRLVIISRGEGSPSHTLVLDQRLIAETGKYVYEFGESNVEELAALNTVAQDGTGTIVRIEDLHQDNMPAPAEIIGNLTGKAGIVYGPMLDDGSGTGVHLTINGVAIIPIDPLFTSEIQGDLNEKDWDGISTRWINRPQTIQLNEDGTITAKVTMTQLPHPPSVGRQTGMTQAQCRDKYLISAGNYGFYIYRNGRLISWADSLGMVKSDQDLYSFRGRLDITSDADDVLNLDVTKSRIHLSDIAEIQLSPLVQEGVKKSVVAWNTAKRRLQSEVDATAHDSINEELSKIGELEEKADQLDEEAAPADERERLKERRSRATEERKATEAEQQQLREEAKRVQYLDSLDNNQLWERAHDPSLGIIVRVNRSHRFFRELIESQMDNAPLVKILDVFFFGLARAEWEVVYKSEIERKLVEAVTDEYRERAGSVISEVVRQLDIGKVVGN